MSNLDNKIHETLEAARLRLGELEKERSKTLQLIETLTGFCETAPCVVVTPPASSERAMGYGDTEAGKSDKKMLSPEQSINAVISIIEENGTPMKYSDVWGKFKALGLPLPGKNPKNTLSARMSNIRQQQGSPIDLTEDKRWTLTKWPPQRGKLSFEEEVNRVTSMHKRLSENENGPESLAGDGPSSSDSNSNEEGGTNM